MASKWSIFLLIAMVGVTFHSSVAQTVHVVGGDSLRWIVPPGGAASYATWASGETFVVGDILVFNFTTRFHNVAEVDKAAYDTCNSESFISIANTGPASLTLSSVGEHYYICTYTMHCQTGMKLAINVTTVSTPAPVPTPASVITPIPVPVPAPASVIAPVLVPAPASAPSPSQAGPTTYVVGDALGWTVPPGGTIVYQTWAANKTFLVGDILLFNFFNGAHNVAQLTSTADFDSCNTSAISAPIPASPAKITLTKPGPHFYFCTFTRHCSLGQKLAINVTETPAAALTPSTSPGPSIAPSSTSTPPPPPSPSSAPTVVVVSLTITLLSLALALFN